jgi:hypothetical protein
MVHIIVTGSRTLTKDRDWSTIFSRLDTIHRVLIITSITQGACPTGADAIAKSWAELNHVQTHDYPADWSQGKKAGPVRNRQMVRDTIRKFKDDIVIVVAFTDKELKNSRGTKNCVSCALDAGLAVKHYIVDDLGSHLQESIVID